MNPKILCLFVTNIIALPSLLALGQATPDVVAEYNVSMQTRDGVTLRADIFRLSGDGKYPVLLERTPYDKKGETDFGRRAAAHGYVVVVQDVRGRYASDGEWYPFKHESADGYDTVEWAAGLPNSNGKVGMFSGSYVGATQMLAAIAHPPHLAGICPIVTASNYHENWVYQGGAFEQWLSEAWTSLLARDTLDHVIRDKTNAIVGSTVLPLNRYPLFNLDTATYTGTGLTGELAPYFLDWLNHPSYDNYWRQWAIDEQYSSIQVPSLTVAGWYDVFQDGSLRNYIGMKAHAATSAARNGQHLLVAPGGHAGWGRNVGAVDFGPDAPVNEHTVMLDWYDFLFKGKQNQFAGKPVRIFVMGEDKWRDEDNWPLARAKETRYFLHSGGKSNTAAGNGSLSTTLAGTEPEDSFIYDPANPVPTVGGPLTGDSSRLPPGPRDQKQVEARPDVLVYSTSPLDTDVEVTGHITLDLFAKSSGVDTDFTAKLVDVSPDGFARNVTEGILRARYRESRTTPSLIEPDKVYEFNIDLWSTSNVFLKGHQIRVEVSSSNFPRFDRNLNTGQPAGDTSAFVRVTNTVLHDAQHPSALVLPIVAR